MRIVGIDVGKNGGIAVISDTVLISHQENGLNAAFSDTVQVYPYSDDTLKEVAENADFAIVEKVGAMPHQGVVSMFNFGQSLGYIRGVLEAYKVPYELVPPQKWKKEFSVTKDKNTSIDVAKRLFPKVNFKASERCKKDHDGMAEALLMAEYGRRKYED